jgi:flavin-dependent thymidylate synthase
MRVIIAGYNKTSEDNLSPEIISASYARVSRQEKSIPEIRDEAKKDLEKARESNKNIVYGVGHSSIAEHVVFNIDIMDVSRFLVEEIESHRLASYTEKSQRYVLFNGDYTTPREITDNPKWNEEYTKLIEEQNKFYVELYPVLLEYFKEENPEKYQKEPKTVEGWAKEDARYIISLATQTQLGMTISARNLELMIKRLKACPFYEAVELADLLYFKVSEITPSLFPYTSPSKLDIKNKKRLYDIIPNENGSSRVFMKNFDEEDMDSRVAEAFHSNIFPIDNKKIILEALKDMTVFDPAPREFEIVDFEFDLRVSASCFAQLKRHRMMTLLPRPYTTTDVIIPKSVLETGMEDKFMEIIRKTNSFFEKTGCYYILTNAHSRDVYVKMNLRELYHFCRMRMDNHAQWEIRELAHLMYSEASYVCPIGMSLCCGKDKFQEVYDSVFTKK